MRRCTSIFSPRCARALATTQSSHAAVSSAPLDRALLLHSMILHLKRAGRACAAARPRDISGAAVHTPSHPLRALCACEDPGSVYLARTSRLATCQLRSPAVCSHTQAAPCRVPAGCRTLRPPWIPPPPDKRGIASRLQTAPAPHTHARAATCALRAWSRAFRPRVMFPVAVRAVRPPDARAAWIAGLPCSCLAQATATAAVHAALCRWCACVGRTRMWCGLCGDTPAPQATSFD